MRDLIEYIAMVFQFLWIFIIKPVVTIVVDFLDWAARNMWFFACMVLLLFIYMERRGALDTDVLPEPVRTIMMTQLLFGIYIYQVVMALILFTVLLYFYRSMRNVIRDVYAMLKRWVSAVILVVLFLYFKIFRIDNREFISLEGAIRWKEIVLVIAFFGGAIAGIVYLGLMQDQMQTDISTKFITDVIEFNDTIIVNGTPVNITSNISDWKSRPLKKYGVLEINMTTTKYGEKKLNISKYVDMVIDKSEQIFLKSMNITPEVQA